LRISIERSTHAVEPMPPPLRFDRESRSRLSRLSVRRAYIVSRKAPRANEARLSSKRREEEIRWW